MDLCLKDPQKGTLGLIAGVIIAHIDDIGLVAGIHHLFNCGSVLKAAGVALISLFVVVEAGLFDEDRLANQLLVVAPLKGTPAEKAGIKAGDFILKIDEKFALHPFIKNELLKPTFQPKINAYNNAVYLILHFPVFDKKTGVSKRREIDFVLGRNFLFTIWQRKLDKEQV